MLKKEVINCLENLDFYQIENGSYESVFEYNILDDAERFVEIWGCLPGVETQLDDLSDEDYPYYEIVVTADPDEINCEMLKKAYFTPIR